MGGLGLSIYLAMAGGFSNALGGAAAGIGGLISWLGGMPGRLINAMGDVGTQLYDAGYRIIGQFASGISAAVGAVTGAIGGVISKGLSLIPHSPAKEGPLSGSGWTDLYQGGQAVINQFAAGMTAGTPSLNAALTPVLSPGITPALSSGASAYGGPSVVIQQATFTDAMDVESFMRQAAWVVQTQRI